jgi:prepilin-type N-terminal cleavage/methylation domain-containing protein
MRLKHSAFTMIELIFVIVIMGIIGKFGVEFLAQAYNSFIKSAVNNKLQANSQSAVEFIANRLQYRIKDSVIARTAIGALPVPVANANTADYQVSEWIEYDYDSFRGNTLPLWSGIIDLDSSNATILKSPDSNTTNINNFISNLSNTASNINDAALYFIGANSDINTSYGWDGNITTIDAQQGAMHPIQSVAGQPNQFTSSTGTNFTGIDLYEYYQLAWTAYAIVMEDYNATGNDTGTLKLYYNYQPWKGEGPADGSSSLIMQNVSTFQFIATGSILKIQVCTKSDLVEEYSLCKEKTIF